jgi:hypothetical protein
MLVVLEYLLAKTIGTIGSTEWQDTGGCGKQYRCRIGWAIGAKGQGKDIDNGLNA